MQFRTIHRLVPLAFLALLLIRCNNENAPGKASDTRTRYDKIATAYCECTTSLAVINAEAQALADDTTQTEQLAAFFQKMQAEYGKAKECSASIIGEFGHLDTKSLDSLQQVLKTACPELAENRDLLREMLGE